MLPINEKALLKMVMGYVNDARYITIDEISIEQRLTDIVKEIEELAMDIEEGEYDRKIGR
uniref:Uncharacterized protein n=3 Tax=viral metagenome TaxID=1070528 RepID=A0A6M3KKD0_9ZZZZ